MRWAAIPTFFAVIAALAYGVAIIATSTAARPTTPSILTTKDPINVTAHEVSRPYSRSPRLRHPSPS